MQFVKKNGENKKSDVLRDIISPDILDYILLKLNELKDELYLNKEQREDLLNFVAQ
ncbi:MAG: hypothetical protein ACTSQE_09710 [Candidatus Heimdallarchaeaceae archaeon]